MIYRVFRTLAYAETNHILGNRARFIVDEIYVVRKCANKGYEKSLIHLYCFSGAHFNKKKQLTDYRQDLYERWVIL